MLNTSADINDALKALSDRYHKNLPVKLAEISALWTDIQTSEKLDADKVQTLYRLVHSLTGSGATFGLTQLSNTSRILEATIKTALVNIEKLNSDVTQRIDSQLSDMKIASTQLDSK